MAKNKKNKVAQEEKKAAADYYRLNTDAVDKLINAKDAPEVSDAEIRKYTSKGKFHIPSAVKILFIKFWFNGAVCYFFLWGLSGYFEDALTPMIVLAAGMGMITDLLVNHLLRNMELEDRENDKWMMVTMRKHWSIFLNVLYAGVVLFFVYRTYYTINMAITGGDKESSILGVEPILYGLFYLGFDMLFIVMKNGLIKLIHDAEKKLSGGDK